MKLWYGLVFTSILLTPCTSTVPLEPSASAKPKPSEQPVTSIQLVFEDQTQLLATLDDSPTAQDFAKLLPLELTLSDYANTEKVADLPRALSTQDAPSSYTPQAGDLTYYSPWGNLAIFYKDFRDSNGLIWLGSLKGDIKALQRGGSLRVRIEAVQSQE